MHAIAFVLFSLACEGHARRVPGATEPLRHSHPAESQAADAAAGLRLERRERVKGRSHPVKSLSKMLLALNPSAQYNPYTAGEIAIGPPPPERIDPSLVMAAISIFQRVKGMNQIPYVTGTFIALSALTQFLQRRKNADKALSVYEYGLQPVKVWRKRGFSWQLVISSFMHTSMQQFLDEMWSLFIHGGQLEEWIRPQKFMNLMAYAAVAPNLVLVLITKLWTSMTNGRAARASYAQSIYVDFSAALNCLITVWRHQILVPLRQPENVFGIPCPSKYASLLELVLQKLLYPDVSILKQVSGWIAALGYLHYPSIRKFVIKKYRQAQKLPEAQQRLLIGGVSLLLAAGTVLAVQAANGAMSPEEEDMMQFRDALDQMLSKKR